MSITALEYFKETLDENNLSAHQSTLYKCPQCLDRVY